MTRPRHVYALEITYPEGSREPGWRPAVWSDPEFLKTLTGKQRRELAKAEFRWPRERMFLSSSGAYGRAGLLRWYGADAEVLASDPVTWPNYDDDSSFSDDSWEHGDTAVRWSPDFERTAGQQREQLAGLIRSGALPVGHAREILGEAEMRELWPDLMPSPESLERGAETLDAVPLVRPGTGIIIMLDPSQDTR